MITTFFDSSQHTFETFPYYLKLRSLTRSLIKPHVELELANTNYIVKTATTAKELAEVLKLRFQVFHCEFSGKKNHLALLKYDIDQFDFKCDHLIVKEKDSHRIVATYRLLSSTSPRFKGHFYSESEFQLNEFLKLPGNKLELGRACVHPDFRNGEVISLLWKGLCQYANRMHCTHMFGCSSLSFSELANLPHVLPQLEKRSAVISEFSVGVLPEFSMDHCPQVSEEGSSSKPFNSLINMYLLAGAKMSSQFAYDKQLKCVDIFTLVDYQQLPESFIRRFAC